MADETTPLIAKEVRSILESVARILVLKKDLIHKLPETDGLALALSGEMIKLMLQVPLEISGDEFIESHINENYLLDLLKAGEDSFIQHKGSETDKGWIDILAANQDKMISMFAGGITG